jgi:3-hydroxyisobutyrate dehydrogenase-like beta-hydroxyacid dehydrogenase
LSDITVIELGLMGSALANALLAAGHDTTVWNRSREKMEPLISTGALGANSLDEALKNSPIALICVSNYSMTSYLLGTDDVVENLNGCSMVQLSSGTPGGVWRRRYCSHY